MAALGEVRTPSPLEEGTERMSLFFQGKVPITVSERAKIRFFLTCAGVATASIIIINLVIFRKRRGGTK
jgi:hypothetical protein